MIETFYRDGALVTEDINPLEYIKLLKRANEIHIDDMYEAIGLLKRWHTYESAADARLVPDTDNFFTKMSGPPRG